MVSEKLKNDIINAVFEEFKYMLIIKEGELYTGRRRYKADTVQFGMDEEDKKYGFNENNYIKSDGIIEIDILEIKPHVEIDKDSIGTIDLEREDLIWNDDFIDAIKDIILDEAEKRDIHIFGFSN